MRLGNFIPVPLFIRLDVTASVDRIIAVSGSVVDKGLPVFHGAGDKAAVQGLEGDRASLSDLDNPFPNTKLLSRDIPGTCDRLGSDASESESQFTVCTRVIGTAHRGGRIEDLRDVPGVREH